MVSFGFSAMILSCWHVPLEEPSLLKMLSQFPELKHPCSSRGSLSFCFPNLPSVPSTEVFQAKPSEQSRKITHCLMAPDTSQTLMTPRGLSAPQLPHPGPHIQLPSCHGSSFPKGYFSLNTGVYTLLSQTPAFSCHLVYGE